jgi:hypothetical protein
MPLTDVGKPAKVQLRRDAARRAFTARMAQILGHDARVSVDIVADDAAGTKAIITVAPAAGRLAAEIEGRIRDEMKAYPTAYAIEWTA